MIAELSVDRGPDAVSLLRTKAWTMGADAICDHHVDEDDVMTSTVGGINQGSVAPARKKVVAVAIVLGER